MLNFAQFAILGKLPPKRVPRFTTREKLIQRIPIAAIIVLAVCVAPLTITYMHINADDAKFLLF